MRQDPTVVDNVRTSDVVGPGGDRFSGVLTVSTPGARQKSKGLCVRFTGICRKFQLEDASTKKLWPQTSIEIVFKNSFSFKFYWAIFERPSEKMC